MSPSQIESTLIPLRAAARAEHTASRISPCRRRDATALYEALQEYEKRATGDRAPAEKEGRDRLRAVIRANLALVSPTAVSDRAVQDVADLYPESWSLVRHARRLCGLDARLVTVVPADEQSLLAWIASGFCCRHLRRAVRGSRPADARRASTALMASVATQRFLKSTPARLARSRCLRHVWSLGEDAQQTVARVMDAMSRAQSMVARRLYAAVDVQADTTSARQRGPEIQQATRDGAGRTAGATAPQTPSCRPQTGTEPRDRKRRARPWWGALVVALVLFVAVSIVATAAVLCAVRALSRSGR